APLLWYKPSVKPPPLLTLLLFSSLYIFLHHYHSPITPVTASDRRTIEPRYQSPS
ncbi:hypothetical protein HAX54_001263, partial [Datura stramonium]|nr:hypothetical protein [Datura stramonium]